jgi:hemolysin activation/secretion protein
MSYRRRLAIILALLASPGPTAFSQITLALQPPPPTGIASGSSSQPSLSLADQRGPALGVSNPQQLPALPTEPLKPGDKPEPSLIPNVPVLPEELPLLPGELHLHLVPPEKPRESVRYKFELAQDAMRPVLPPLEKPMAGNSLAAAAKVTVKKFVFEGNHAFSSRQLAKVVAAYAGREITSEELEEARVALTKHYVDAGFITSGALLPDQDVTTGVIRFQIVEGRLKEIDLRGNFWYRAWWLRNQLRQAAGRPVNFNDLKTGLQLLRQNPTISRINAELKPGSQTGESILDVSMKDEQPFRFGFTVGNTRPPSVAEGIGELYLTDVNLTGHNDPLDLHWGLARWTKEGAVNYAGFDNVSGAYEFPITPWDTTVALHASKLDSSVIDETFASLGITSETKQYGVALRQPVYRTLRDTVTVSLAADREQSTTFLLGQPFSLEPGAIDGKSTVFATRLTIDWTNRSQVHVLALRSVFNVGWHAFGSTKAEAGVDGTTSGAGGLDLGVPDSKFFSWIGQAQYVRRLFDTPAFRDKPDVYGWNILRETTLVLRVNAQLSDRPLLSLEQFSIGGMQSVRGYRENQLLRDDGVFGSAEVRVPLWLAKDKTPIVSFAPFFDCADGWNSDKLNKSYQTIYSSGVGLLVNATKHAQITVYWGHPFVNFHEEKVSLQDYGLHFAVSINAF